MKKLFIIAIIFIISIFISTNIYATSNDQLEPKDSSVELSEEGYEENSVRSVPGGEEPDNEDWYGIKLAESGIPENPQEIDYSQMPELLTHLKPGDIIYEPNGAFSGDLVGHIAMVLYKY